jgi:hypothetical protein
MTFSYTPWLLSINFSKEAGKILTIQNRRHGHPKFRMPILRRCIVPHNRHQKLKRLSVRRDLKPFPVHFISKLLFAFSG